MSSKFLNANTDVNLSANSDSQIPSQKAVKTYVDNKTSVLATKGELTTGLSEKQDVISDLDTIRQGAALGATALQAVPDEYVTETELAALNFVKWVDTLPETGESKYIYAVPREETDTDGKQIAALYLWDGSAWRGAGAFSLNIDPATLATKTELAGYLPLTGGDMGIPVSTYTYVNSNVYYYWNKLFNITDIGVNSFAVFLITFQADYNTPAAFSYLLYVSRYGTANSYSVMLSPLASFGRSAVGTLYVAADVNKNIYVQAYTPWIDSKGFKIIKIVGGVKFTPEKAGYALIGEDPENFTSFAKIEDSGAFRVNLSNNSVNSLPDFNNVLKLTSKYAISDKNGNNIDTTYISNATKGIANGVASLDANAKVPESQIPLSFTIKDWRN